MVWITPDSIILPPASSVPVSISVLNSFKHITLPASIFLAHSPEAAPSSAGVPLVGNGKAFFLKHPSGRHVVVDLGIRQDVEGISPAAPVGFLMSNGLMTLDQGPLVPDQLVSGGVDLDSIEAIIWTHSHWDHTGDPSAFPESTKLVVGPGTLAHFRPGYPLNQTSPVLESDFEGREIVELDFEHAPIIAGLKAFDYFGDQSFWLLEAPGHCPGHMVGLVQTTVSPATWLLLGGDIVHHVGLIRPSPFLSLPASISLPAPCSACPRDAPLLVLPKENSVHHDSTKAQHMLEWLVAIDARPEVFVVLSHDTSLDPDLDDGGVGILLFPKEVNRWKEHGWKDAVRWRFLQKGNTTWRWD